MVSKTLFILMLSKLHKLGPVNIRKIISQWICTSTLDMNSLKNILEKDHPDIDLNLIDKNIKEAKSDIEYYETQSVTIKNFLDKDFPKSLLEIENLPVLIFVRGSDAIFSVENKNIAIIGTRKPSNEGRNIAFNSAKLLSDKGFCVVSGLALGCDTEAHKGCLETNGLTTAVLAHGLDMISPSSNKGLAQRIIEKGGALVSEYPFGVVPKAFTYIQRNRIQSALSNIIILIESELNGGSMTTIKFAMDQGKKVWVYQPSEFSKSTSGNKKLLTNITTQKSLLLEPEHKTEESVKSFRSIEELENLVNQL